MYFDPGTGSMIIQTLIAVAAGIGVFFSMIKNKIIKIGKGKKKNDK